jgi:hypothetical protein
MFCSKSIWFKDGSLNFIGDVDSTVDRYLAIQQNIVLFIEEKFDAFHLTCELLGINNGVYFTKDIVTIHIELRKYVWLNGEEIGLFLRNSFGTILSYITKPIDSNDMYLNFDSTPIKEGMYSIEIFAHLPNQKITFKFKQNIVFMLKLRDSDLPTMSNKRDHGIFNLDHSWTY